MSAIITLYKDSGRTQPLSAATAWGANQFADLGSVDITSGAAHPTGDIHVWGANTGDQPASNVLIQAAPAKQATAGASGAVSGGANILVSSSALFSVGMVIDIVAAIADPGSGADYSYPLTLTTRVAGAVVTAVPDGTHIQLDRASGTLAVGDEFHTAGTLGILGEIQVADDAAGSVGTYGSQGASKNIGAGPYNGAGLGTFALWVKGNWVTANVEGTHRFELRSRATSG